MPLKKILFSDYLFVFCSLATEEHDDRTTTDGGEAIEEEDTRSKADRK